MSYILKHIPEDFVVKEVPITFSGSGPFRIYLLRKKNYDTEKAIQSLSKATGILRKFFGYAGAKDRQAVTEQYISIKSDRNLDNFSLEDIHLTFISYHNHPLSLGDLKGNTFTITLRNLEKEILFSQKEAFIPNYFDEQRFSTQNVTIGKLLLQKKFDLVYDSLKNQEMIDHLLKHERDFVGALKLIPQKILSIYIHAYQSYLWNQSVYSLLKSHKGRLLSYSLGQFYFPDTVIMQDKFIPLIGFDVDPQCDSSFLDIIYNLLHIEGITHRDFIFKEFPYLSSEGDLRALWSHVLDITLNQKEDDEHFSEKYKQSISFTLEKGSYATLFIKYLFLLQ